jgi:hypothetical protein
MAPTVSPWPVLGDRISDIHSSSLPLWSPSLCRGRTGFALGKGKRRGSRHARVARYAVCMPAPRRVAIDREFG